MSTNSGTDHSQMRTLGPADHSTTPWCDDCDEWQKPFLMTPPTVTLDHSPTVTMQLGGATVVALLLALSTTVVGEEEDLWKVLGVPRTADASTIKRRYRGLARETHPDKNLTALRMRRHARSGAWQTPMKRSPTRSTRSVSSASARSRRSEARTKACATRSSRGTRAKASA